MPDEYIRIEVKGLEELKKAVEKFPRESAKYLGQAGKEAFRDVISKTPGLGVGKKGYPAETAANAPPTPYYIRGRGMMYKSGLKATSERLGTQWYARNVGKGFATEIGNRSSYARWVVGEDQAKAMGRIGWRKLRDVIDEKMEQITHVYQAWVDKLLRDVGLR